MQESALKKYNKHAKAYKSKNLDNSVMHACCAVVWTQNTPPGKKYVRQVRQFSVISESPAVHGASAGAELADHFCELRRQVEPTQMRTHAQQEGNAECRMSIHIIALQNGTTFSISLLVVVHHVVRNTNRALLNNS